MANPSMSVFSQGFANGLVLRGQPLVQTQVGSAYWVYNGTVLPQGHRNGSDSNKGTFNAPFATIAGALLQCTANRGDVIFVKPGHAETITAAAGLILSVAGVAIIGLGSGALRPTITFTTANTASITVTASQVSVQNIKFVANFLNIATCFSIANAQVAKDFAVDSCEFVDTDSSHNWISVLKVGTTANIADGLIFNNNRVFFQATGGALTQAVVLASIVDRMQITNNFVIGSATTAQTGVLLGLGTSLNHTNVQISGNRVVTPSTDSTNGTAVNGSGTMTGLASDNYVANLDNTASIWIPTGLGLMYVQNFSHITAAADKNALVNPAAV